MATIQAYDDKKYNNASTISSRCPLCKSTLIVFDVETGEVICSSCGIVISENSFDNTDATTRTRSVGASTSLIRHDMGLSTIIGRTNRDASGNIIDASTYSKMQRLRT
jgi:transcription initiation factor TFIIB